MFKYDLYSPVNTFLIIRGISPLRESFPPSKLNPNPDRSFNNSTRIRGLSLDDGVSGGDAEQILEYSI